MCSELRNPAECADDSFKEVGNIPAWNTNGEAGKHMEEGRENFQELKLESDTEHVNKDVLRHSQGRSDCSSQEFQELQLPEIP